jgi:hypothetical protein
MATEFAHVVDGKVVEVLCIDQDHINTGLWGSPSEWIQTDPNTWGNQHYADSSYRDPDTTSQPLRGNHAGIGYTYDAAHDVFYPPQPYPSWVLNQTTWLWQAPVPYPTNGQDYKWDEATTSWVLVPGDAT